MLGSSVSSAAMSTVSRPAHQWDREYVPENGVDMTTGFVLSQGFQNVGIDQVEGNQVLHQPQVIEGDVSTGKVECGILTVVVGVRDDIQHVRRETPQS